MSEYVYQRTEFSPYELYTVGYYDTNGNWHSESDYKTTKEAAMRVSYLNGGNSDELDRLQQENEQLREVLRLAVEDMSNIKLATQCINCFLCLSKAKSRNETFLPCGGCSSWQWQHADKLQELRVEK